MAENMRFQTQELEFRSRYTAHFELCYEYEDSDFKVLKAVTGRHWCGRNERFGLGGSCTFSPEREIMGLYARCPNSALVIQGSWATRYYKTQPGDVYVDVSLIDERRRHDNDGVMDHYSGVIFNCDPGPKSSALPYANS